MHFAHGTHQGLLHSRLLNMTALGCSAIKLQHIQLCHYACCQTHNQRLPFYSLVYCVYWAQGHLLPRKQYVTQLLKEAKCIVCVSAWYNASGIQALKTVHWSWHLIRSGYTMLMTAGCTSEHAATQSLSTLTPCSLLPILQNTLVVMSS